METAKKTSILNLRRAGLALSGLLFLLSVLLCLVLAAVSWQGVLPSLYWQLHYMVALLLVTILTRTITVPRVLGFYFLGIGACGIIAVIFSTPARLIFNMPFWADVPVPIVEETVKILPLLLIVFWPGSSWRRHAGLTDFLVAGAALGSGFTLLEDLLRGYEWHEMLTYRVGPHIGPVFLFPAADLQYGLSASRWLHLKSVFLGHGPATAMIALALGVAVIYGRRAAWWRTLWALPALAWVWVVWDHVWFNLSSDGAFEGAAGVIQSLFGLRGHLSSWVLLGAGLAAIIVDLLAIRKYWGGVGDADRLPLSALSLWKRSLDRRTPLYLYLLIIARPQLRRQAAYAARNQLPTERLRTAVEHLSVALRRVLPADKTQKAQGGTAATP